MSKKIAAAATAVLIALVVPLEAQARYVSVRPSVMSVPRVAPSMPRVSTPMKAPAPSPRPTTPATKPATTSTAARTNQLNTPAPSTSSWTSWALPLFLGWWAGSAASGHAEGHPVVEKVNEETTTDSVNSAK